MGGYEWVSGSKPDSLILTYIRARVKIFLLLRMPGSDLNTFTFGNNYNVLHQGTLELSRTHCVLMHNSSFNLSMNIHIWELGEGGAYRKQRCFVNTSKERLCFVCLYGLSAFQNANAVWSWWKTIKVSLRVTKVELHFLYSHPSACELPW